VDLSNAPSKITQVNIHKSKLYTVLAVPTLVYGCKTWALNRRDKIKIETAEMRFLRNVAGYTRRDEISNLTIHKKLVIKYK
jgi:hypothetical protein